MSKKTIKIGLFGLGTVGTGVMELLQENAKILEDRTGAALQVTKIVTLEPDDTKGLDMTGIQIGSDAGLIFDDPEIDIVLELIGGKTFAKDIHLRSFTDGKSMVTANKALIAEKSDELFKAAYASEGMFGFEAAVAGGIPIIRALKEGFSGDKITEISGIINGTANFILTKMSKEGSDFQTALTEAQELGYAEADPTFDVEGQDTAHKLLIMMNIAFNGLFSYEDLYVEGITNIEPFDIELAEEFGYDIKLLGKAVQQDGKYQGRVHPSLVSKENMLSNVSGAFNAVEVKGNYVGPTMHYGAGAGSHPTASAVVADVVAIARQLLTGSGQVVEPLCMPLEKLEAKKMIPMSEINSAYYLRFMVQDNAGVLSQITSILGKHGISILSMIQKNTSANASEPVSVVMFTHQANENSVLKALAEIDQLPIVAGQTKIIRVNS